MEMTEVEVKLVNNSKEMPETENHKKMKIYTGQYNNADLENGFHSDHRNSDVIFRKKKMADNTNSCSRVVARLQRKTRKLYRQHRAWMWKIVGFICLILYLAYAVYSLTESGLDGESSMRLLVCSIIGLVILLLRLVQDQLKPLFVVINTLYTSPKYLKLRTWIRWSLYIASTVLTVTLMIVLVAIDTPKNLLSLAGLAALVILCFLTSYSPAMIDWHPVFWGFSAQFYFALIILKTRWGFEAFNWLGDRVSEFLAYSDAGAKLIFGDNAFVPLQDGTTLNIKHAVMSDGSALPISSLQLVDQSSLVLTSVYTIHLVAFKVLPVVIFFNCFISIMSYFGVMKFVVNIIGRALSLCLGTTPAESLSAAGNVFVGMTEAPLIIRPFLGEMTSSELHAIMTGGFATIAGSMLGVYIGFGVPADHLLTASVISAPAALAISKITYPEVEIPMIKPEDYENLEQLNSKARNVMEAACDGAVLAGKLCAAILVNVIAFVSLLKFVNSTLTWFGERAGVEDLTLELICSYLLYPVALFIGTDLNDCRRVAELIGVKIFTNEFIAYSKLSVMITNRKTFENYIQNPNNTWHKDHDDIYLHALNNRKLENGILQSRSEVIATYSLCGFANFSSMGILLGGLSALAPHRTPTLSKLIVRAMIAGNIACFSTACIAGLYY